MAIKPPDLLNRLPSVSELLDKPPVRALVDRWNRSVVANNLRTYLDELRTDLERRAADLPSIRELAERAANFVAAKQHHTLGTTINATGQICGAPWSSTPLAEAALERMIALGREFTVDEQNAATVPDELKAALCRISGAQAATAVHSYSGAIWLALAAHAGNREIIVSRAEVGDVDGVYSLPKLSDAAGATLREVGATNRTATAEYEAAISTNVAAILKISNDAYRVVGDFAAAELSELVALGHSRQLLVIDALGAAPLVQPPASLTWPRRSAQESIAAGADLVVLRGDCLVGGPACGVLLGKTEIIDRLQASPLFAAMRLDALRSAALAATLAAYEHESPTGCQLPIWQCLQTSVDNLRNRADRLAAQLAYAPGVSSANAIEIKSPISAAFHEGWPSFGVALLPTDGNVAALDERLQAAQYPTRGRIEGTQLVLDLRTVLPRQDKLIVDALLGSAPEVRTPQPNASDA